MEENVRARVRVPTYLGAGGNQLIYFCLPEVLIGSWRGL
jgi:hypothetical protein